MPNTPFDERPEVVKLLTNIKTATPRLVDLQKQCRDLGDDGVYRYYHQSYKIYDRLQGLTTKIVSLLRDLSPFDGQPLDEFFEEIVEKGTGQHFKPYHNENWTKHTRPIVEAYFHARWFLDQLVKAASEIDRPPNLLPEGWAAILSLYNLR